MLFAVAGCSGTTGGQAVPASQAGQWSSSAPVGGVAGQLPGPGVPKVQNPIDTTKASQDPCGVLTADQIKGFIGGLVTPKSDRGPAGPECAWFGGYEYEHASIGVIINGVSKRGLTSVYANKGKLLKFFQPFAPAEGYPLVVDDFGEKRTFGKCNGSLGVRDDQTIEIFVEQPDSRKEKKDPCVSLHDVAVAIIGNIRGGQ
ncbi:DUF3558 domain-containing protein [Amycolatopsis sulphurea]|uniref:DUF3558 domain-containing protein n=1 Tax=Amycolatopsis sulphurea TaxID=76022 RepID=UPI0014728730|nr:DUF3558 domain-containing protein [Amycolatopsis sulphurea]